jgi:hypothetical protein
MKRRIAIATGSALAVAAVLLVTVVLPAEFGRDPLGTGQALGLLALYGAGADDDVAALPAAPATTVRPREYKIDASELEIGPGQAFEYKYRLEKGAGMVYAWTATAPLKFEFHGEADDRAIGVESYEKSSADYASGTLTAGFTGIHGWYWENTGDRKVTLTVSSAGFFTEADEMRPKWDPVKHKNRIEHIPHELSTPSRAPSAPK